jgi:hypothetical protein
MDNMLFAGLRGPLVDNRAAIVSASVDTLFGGTGTAHRLYRLPLGEGRGVRDLAVFDNRILILAGPATDGSANYAIFSWDANSEQVNLLADLPFDTSRKPEALLPLDKTASVLRVLILFDGESEGSPTPLTISLR